MIEKYLIAFLELLTRIVLGIVWFSIGVVACALLAPVWVVVGTLTLIRIMRSEPNTTTPNDYIKSKIK
jgi:hypothetical protein